MRGLSLLHRKITLALALATILATTAFGVIVFAPKSAQAQAGPCGSTGPCPSGEVNPAVLGPLGSLAPSQAADTANSTALNADAQKKSAGELLRISLTNTAAVAVLNGLNYFAQKIAYDTAVYAASGGKGQKPLIFDNPGAYFKTVGADAAGEVLGTLTTDPATFGKYGVNLCSPTLPKAALNIKIGLLNSLPSFGVGAAPTPKCTWDSISNNWETFTGQSSADVLENVGVMFSPGQSSLSAAIEVNNVVLKEITRKKEEAKVERLEGDGIKPVTDKVSGTVTTPAPIVKKTMEYSVESGFKVTDNTTQITAGAFGAGALGVLSASLKTFAGTLTNTVMKKLFEKGFVSVTDMLGLGDEDGDNGLLTFDGQPPTGGRAAAELANASLLTPKILTVSSYNELLEFASCPEEGRTPSNCVIDQQFFGALSRAEQGATVTLRQAIQQGYVNRNWQLLPLAHQKNLQGNCYAEAFCYSNLVKLRRSRIIPAGWELAANSPFNDVSRPVTLGEAMDRFNDCPMTTDADGNSVVDESKLPDPLHPWCHLVDPEWVLKYPAASCRQRGPGPTLISPSSSSRAQICVDVATCVAEDASGNCVGGYGYCVREKNVWQLDADACPGQYASCTTYNRASGGAFSFLSNTLDGADCNSQNAGCRQYSLSPNAVPNPGFEEAFGDLPRDWTLTSQAGYHRGGRLSVRGSNAVGVSVVGGVPSTARTQISGLLPTTDYRLSASVIQEDENTSAVGRVRLQFKDDKGVVLTTPAADVATNCAATNVGGGQLAVDLEIVTTSLGYLSGACDITLPEGAVAAELTLSSNAVGGNLTWFDEVGLFGGSYSSSPYDVLFMNAKAEKCSDDQAGCSQFMRLKTGTLNQMRNPSFETIEAGVPAFWGGAAASRVENGTLLGSSGVSAYALSATPITQTVEGMMADAAYTFSIQTRLDAPGARSGTARIQLYDSSRPPQPVSPSTVDGCTVSAGAIVINLAAGEQYALSTCRFTTGAEAGSAVVSLASSGDLAPRMLADAVQLELSVRSTNFHEGYSPATESIFLKKAPEGLNCAGSNPPEACANFAPSCRREEVGCNSYRPVDGGTEIPAVATEADLCPAECSGYDTFRQEPSNFSDPEFPVFLIPSTAQRCSAAEAGCSEFTNIERLAAGGEALEYYSYLRLCAQPGPQSATYYTWEGNEDSGDGIQLRSWDLLRSNIAEAVIGSADPTGGNAPCTKIAYDVSGSPVCADDAASVEAASCSRGFVGIDADCREFYDDEGNIHYRLYSKTVVSTADCKEYRMTKTTEPECESHGGFWRNGECRYRSYAAESTSCRVAAAGCRAYSGNASRNVRVVFTDTFESLTTDGWSSNPDGSASGFVINSNESVAAAGHSLKVTAPAGQTAIAFKDATSSIRGGRQYLLSFWAKGTGDVVARFQTSGASFTADRAANNQERPVALTTEWKPYQVGPVELPASFSGEEQLVIERLGGGTALMYLDNVELRELAENIYLIEDSWETPLSCDETPTGDPAPQYMLGCRAFTDRENVRAHFKSFEKICRPEAVGCEALYDTRNSESPFAQTFNAVCERPDGGDADTAPDVCTSISCPCQVAGKQVCEVVIGFTSCRYDADHAVDPANISPTGDTARVAADGITYLVNDPRFRCDESNLGCTEVGDRTMNPDRLSVMSWGSKLLKNVPASYSATLCKSSEEFCQAYTRRADGAQVHFKDPDTRVCEFRESTTAAVDSEGQSLNVTGNGWFRKGSDEPCDEEFLEAGTRFGIWKNSDARYDGWAGTCSPQFDMCKEFIDPEDRSPGYAGGKPYYAIMNDRLDLKTCQGRASLRRSPSGANDASACVLFWQTDDLKKTYDAASTYAASEANDGGLVTPIDGGAANNTANVIIKVKRDRQCGEWLDCRSSETVFNPTSGQHQSVCTAFSLCAEYERVGNSTRCIRYVDSSYADKTLSAGVYAARDVSWEGMEYSGYGIPNRYPVEELVTFDVAPTPAGGAQRVPDLRLVRVLDACVEDCGASGTSSCSYGSLCGPAGDKGTCLGPNDGLKCVYPIDGGRRVTSASELYQPQNATGYPPSSCRIYPQDNAPFPSSIADPGGWDSSPSDINGGNPVLIGTKPAFSAANVCQRRLVNGIEISSCECSYIIAKYGSTTKYLPSGGADMPVGYCASGPYDGYECDPLASGARTRSNLSCCTKDPDDGFGLVSAGCDDGGRCVALTKVDRVVGYEGQCLERDFTSPINGRNDQFACITWRPVNLVGGSRDIYNQHQTAGYFAAPDRRFYCVGDKPEWAVIMNINPDVTAGNGPRQQVTTQFFGEGRYNRRVDNYQSVGGDCSHDADSAGGTRWCIYPGISERRNLNPDPEATPDYQRVLSSNPIGILGCYEVSDPNRDSIVVDGGSAYAEIVWPYIGPPIYRDQLKSIFFQISDDIYQFDPDDEGSGPYFRGNDDETDNGNSYDQGSYTSNTSDYKIIIPDTAAPQGSASDDGKPAMELIATNPHQHVFRDCNDDGPDNIDSSNDDDEDSRPYTESTALAGIPGVRGLYYLTEENKWQVDASDNEGKIGFFAKFDANDRLKEIIHQAEADSGENGEGTYGINSMGFAFKAGCEQVARVDVAGEFGLTRAYTNALNPARNFTRTSSDDATFVDGDPYNFTSYSQACQAYGAIGAISSNPPAKPWTYVTAIARYNAAGDPSASGVEHPLQCTGNSFRTGSRYLSDGGIVSVAQRTIRKIFRAVTQSWVYRELSGRGTLAVTNDSGSYLTSTGAVFDNYDAGTVAYDDTGAIATPATNFNGGVEPPRVASVDVATCDANGRCGSGAPDSITLSGKQEGLILGADGALNVSARFFAWASHNAMPIIRRTILWGDFTPNEPAAKGWYKNQKPFCSPDISDENAVGECSGIRGLTCNDDVDCPEGISCNHDGNSFGNTPGACNATPYQFDHTYVCALSDLEAMEECDAAVPATNAPCYRMVTGSPVCVYRPKVQIVDNWGWCNCTGTGCRIPGRGGYTSDDGDFDDCNLENAPDNAKPWTEFDGEIRLAPTYQVAQAFTPSGGGGGGSGSGGDAVNDSFTTIAGIYYSPARGTGVLENDTTTGPATSRRIEVVRQPSNGRLAGICDPRDCFTITPEGHINYVVNSGFHGTDTFTYKIVQGGADSNVATVTINIP